jgi:hypothetical protein
MLEKALAAGRFAAEAENRHHPEYGGTGAGQIRPLVEKKLHRLSYLLDLDEALEVTVLLPDYLQLKNDIRAVLDRFLRRRAHQHLGGGLNEVPRTTIHEGHTSSIVRASGKRDVTEMFEVSATFELKRDEVPDLSPGELLTKLDSVAKEMGEKQAKQFLSSLSDQIDRAGNTLEAKGEKMSAALLLKLLETIDIDFDENGVAQLPSMLIPPSLGPAAEAANRAMFEDPDVIRQRDRIIAKKREEWRAREADRRLVG